MEMTKILTPAEYEEALGLAEGVAMTTTFLASTPMTGLSGLFFHDFAN